MTQEELKLLRIHSVLLHKLHDQTSLLVLCDTLSEAERFHRALFENNFKVRVYEEIDSGRYIFDLHFIKERQGIKCKTHMTKKTVPQLVWIDNSAVNHLRVAFLQSEQKMQLVGTPFPIQSPFHPN
jgi:hypothetical protein